MPVGDQARPQAIIGELVPDVIRMPFDLTVRPVPQVRAESRSRIDGRLDLLGRGGRMPDGNDHTEIGEAANEFCRALIVGR